MLRRPLATAAAALLLSGCNVAGPVALSAGRQDYNEAIQHTSNEQLLLNLVRLRYMDPPLFLEVGSVTASYQLDASLGAGASVPNRGATAGTSFSPSFRMGWIERPTVAYLPLQGDKFVTQLLAPISLEHLLLLYHSGWSVERILRVCVQHLNGLPNAPSASGPTPVREPVFRDFLEVARLLRALQVERGLELGIEEHEGKQAIVLRIPEAAAAREELTALREKLGLPGDARRLVLSPGVGKGAGERVTIQTRSLMGVLFYLSQGIEVPGEHAAAGVVPVTRRASGEPFAWSELLGDLFRIQSEEPPGGALVAVGYRGQTFYLAETDLASKSTFVFLSQLFALQAGHIQSTAPVLTLSVGG